jgi:hypothetical protein
MQNLSVQFIVMNKRKKDETTLKTPSQTPFCAICGKHHDPSIFCLWDNEGQALREIGIEPVSKTPKTSLRRIMKNADVTMLIILMLLALFIVARIIKGY